MKTLKFQTESPAFTAAQRRDCFPAAFTFTAESGRAGIESLLIGLCLREWLTDSEKNFLDFLAPHDTLLFVIREGIFLHPEDTDLFPLELIETAVNEGGEAFFSHRLQSPGDRAKNHYRVHTAHIRTGFTEPLILGMLCPDNAATEFEYTNSFCDLAIAFRKTSENINALAAEINNRYRSEKPTLLINRSSGRILGANPAATGLFDLPERHLADMEYSRFKHRLSDIMADYKIKMDNIPKGDNSLTVMSFSSEKTVARKEDPFLMDHFLDSMMDKISSATTATSYLGSLTDIGRNTEETELIEMILREINEMERNLSRFYTLTNCRHLSPQKVNLRAELERAVEKVRTRYDTGLSVTITDNAGVTDYHAPASAFLCLFESTLLAHQEVGATNGTTRVCINPTSDDGLAAVFETETSARGHSENATRHWLRYSRLLAKKLGLNLNHNKRDDSPKFITEIIIPKQDCEI